MMTHVHEMEKHMKLFDSFLMIILVTALSASSQIKIACVGNSITENSGYTDKLQALLGSGYTVTNYGASGSTLLRHGDMPYYGGGKFSSVFAQKPDIITIKLGTNDSKSQNWSTHGSEFTADYNAMIDTFLTITPRPQVWLVLCMPAWYNGFGINGDIIHQQIVPQIQAIATARSLPVIDCHYPLVNVTEADIVNPMDGVHPNSAGADSLARFFYRALTGGQTRMQEMAVARQPYSRNAYTVCANRYVFSNADGQWGTGRVYSLKGTELGLNAPAYAAGLVIVKTHSK
jgi:lysophospholipase L1-like esterase